MQAERRRKLVRAFSLLTRSHYWSLGLCLLIVFFALLIQLVLPLGLSIILDALHQTDGSHKVNQITCVLIGLFIFRSVLAFASQYYLQAVGDDFIFRLRKHLYQHLYSLGIVFHEERRLGEIESRLNNDIGSVRLLVTATLVSVITNSLQLLGTAAVMLIMNWKLGLMAIAVGSLAWVLSKMFGPLFRHLSIAVQDELATASAVAQESLAGVETVLLFGREAHEVHRYESVMMKYLHVLKGIRLWDSFYNALLAFVVSSSTIVIFWVGGREVLSGAISTGTLVAFLLYTQSVSQLISGLGRNYSSISQALGASQRVFEMLDLSSPIVEKKNGAPLDAKSANICFDAVHFQYGQGIDVIKNVSFEVKTGETVALVGPSGAGKSTLSKLILRFYDVSGGNIYINGSDIRDYTLWSLRQAISVVSQDVFLFAASVRENIRYGRLDASDEEVEAAARAANAHEFVMRLEHGYESAVSERGVKLSGGQRQRISIARALLKNSPILILDEATSALDNESEHLVQEAINRLKEHRTTLIIAHRQSTVKTADKIIVIVDGSIAEQGSYEELVERGGIYSRLLGGKSVTRDLLVKTA